MGRLEEAREVIVQLRTLTPFLVPSATHWRDPDYRELFLSGLRVAMGETRANGPTLRPKNRQKSWNQALAWPGQARS